MHLQHIKINNSNNSQLDLFPSKDFMLPYNDGYAITTDALYVALVEVTPDPEHPGEYVRKANQKHIHVAIDDERTLKGLEGVAQTLRTMSAYDLLTKHYNQKFDSFYVNRNKDFVADYFDGEDAPPVNEYGARDGKDY
jgi:hypothetical protein